MGEEVLKEVMGGSGGGGPGGTPHLVSQSAPTVVGEQRPVPQDIPAV